MTTTDNMNSIYSFLKSKGLKDGAIAGIMGNLQVESNFNPSITNGIGAFGLAQWLGGRKSGLLGQSNPTSLSTQENYLWSEISSGKQGVTVSQLNQMTPSQAAAYFSNQYERPGNDGSLGKRVSDANTIYSQISNGKLTYSPSSGSTDGATVDTSGLTNMSFPTTSSITNIMQQGLGILIGAGIVFLGVWIAMNPFSDLSSSIMNAATTLSKKPLEGITNQVRKVGK